MHASFRHGHVVLSPCDEFDRNPANPAPAVKFVIEGESDTRVSDLGITGV
jgi:hypothetical protein